ncbi:MAG: hypothetical protein ACOX7L_03265 [Dethiobacteria bacterium]
MSIVIMEGGNPTGDMQKMLVSARRAAIFDNIAKLKEVESIGTINLLTNYPLLAEKAAAYGVKVHKSSTPQDGFHFGRALRGLINHEGLRHVIYMGGAGVPLIKAEELRDACEFLLIHRPVIYSNNTMSADIVAFSPGELINSIVPPEMDNILAVALSGGTGVEHRLFPMSTGFLFDLDTPADLLILAGSALAGAHLRAFLKGLDLDLAPLQRVKKVLRGEYKDVALLGRVGAPAIAKINRSLKVRLRVFSEERGMRALGRQERGEVVSLLAFFLQETGPQRFFRYLERICSAALLDTRVLMAHLGPGLTAEDRYLSDLGRWREMGDPFFREFTRCAVESTIPILLGGHNLVLGGLWVLAEEIASEAGRGGE